MIIQDPKKRAEEWDVLLERKSWEELREALLEAPPIEVADFISTKKLHVGLRLFCFFEKADQAVLFSHFSEEAQLRMYDGLPRRALADIFMAMPSDERVDFYQRLDEKEQSRLLPYLSKDIRQDVLALCAYSVDTAGGIMSTDFVTTREDMTVSRALEKIREDAPSRKMMYYIYAVDEDMRVKGVLSLKDLVLENSRTMIRDILHDNFVFVGVNEDRESVAHKIEKYDLVALPVLNEEGQLVGIVSYDDAMDVIRAEQTEDMERFMGISQDEHRSGYLQTSSLQHFRKRVTWIVGLFFASFVSALVMHYYERTLSHLAILMLYFPMINDAGGNTGSQAATVVVRALSLGEVSVKDSLLILLKELKISLMFVFCLFFLGFFKVLLFSGFLADTLFDGNELPLPAEGLYRLALVIAIALSIQVFFAIMIGVILTLVIQWLGLDAGVIVGPITTTMLDATGLTIYFTTATFLLGGS